MSLSDYIETSSEGMPLALMDVLGQEEDLMETVSNRELVRQVRKAMDEQLSKQEKQVIVLRYGLEGNPPHRQREVAAVTGISRSYVSRIEKRALQKLRAALE